MLGIGVVNKPAERLDQDPESAALGGSDPQLPAAQGQPDAGSGHETGRADPDQHGRSDPVGQHRKDDNPDQAQQRQRHPEP